MPEAFWKLFGAERVAAAPCSVRTVSGGSEVPHASQANSSEAQATTFIPTCISKMITDINQARLEGECKPEKT